MVFPLLSAFAQPRPALLPVPDHVVVLILENKGYSQIIGTEAAPHINAWAKDSLTALFTRSYAIQHPSQPNYIALFSGSNQGVNDNYIPKNIPFKTPNLARQLLDAGKTFATYSEDLPGVGYDGEVCGAYARKHNPVANWMGADTSQVPPETNRPFSDFPTEDFTSLPTISFVVPNQDNDMHNGTDPDRIMRGDQWSYDRLAPYRQWAMTHNSLFVLTFDEDGHHDGNRIVTLFTGAMIKKGQYSQHITHYTLLRTLEDLYGLPYAGHADTATTIGNCWAAADTAPVHSSPDDAFPFAISPTSSATAFQLRLSNERLATHPGLEVKIFALRGEVVHRQVITTQYSTIFLTEIPAGLYIAQVGDGQNSSQRKFIVP